MSKMYETTILQEGLVRITNRRTLIGTQTCSMSEINSVTVSRRGKSTRPFWLVPVGILLILWSIFDETWYCRDFFILGIVPVIAGLALALIEKPSYVVQIRSASGLSDILGSTDLEFIQRIVGAMHRASGNRGGEG